MPKAMSIAIPQSLTTLNFDGLVDKAVLASELDMGKAYVLREQMSSPVDTRMSVNNGVDSVEISGPTGQETFAKPKKQPIKVFSISQPTETQDKYILLQKWEGVVSTITGDSFVAILRDLTVDGIQEEAEIFVDEVPPSDRELLVPGAVFYWGIGYLDTARGGRIRASEIRFRRLPAWNKNELARARKEAEEISGILGWNTTNSRTRD